MTPIRLALAATYAVAFFMLLADLLVFRRG